MLNVKEKSAFNLYEKKRLIYHIWATGGPPKYLSRQK